MNIKLVDLTRQYNLIRKKIIRRIEKILDSCNFIMGVNVKELESKFSQYIGVKNSISVGNGTDALVIALKAIGIQPGDEVITSPYTFFATAESISRVGAIPVFVDIDLETYNIDVAKIEDKITKKTKAILPVHIFGQPCDMQSINKVAKKHKLYVVEDACQAVGAKINGKMIGSLSDIACFSFFPTKNLGCAGDGGIITTNNDNIATICRALRAHGSGKDGSKAYSILTGKKDKLKITAKGNNTIYNSEKYYNYLIGYNSRLDEIQAAILLERMKYLEKYNNDRIKTAKFFSEKLKSTSLVTPKVVKNGKHVFHLYILQSNNRNELIDYLNNNGISTGVYYQVPLHLQKAMEIYKYKKGECPNAEFLSMHAFAIPIFPLMTKEEKRYIVDKLKEWDEIHEQK